MFKRMIAVAAAVALHGGALAAQPSPAMHDEVAHLLNRLASSGCTFQRNGSWHNAADARAHLEKKYAYLRNKGKIRSAEHFIELAATRSSMTGAAYMVKCMNQPVVASASWLGAQLREVRAQKR